VGRLKKARDCDSETTIHGKGAGDRTSNETGTVRGIGDAPRQDLEIKAEFRDL